MAVSEREPLSKKAEAVKKTYDEAVESLNSLRSDLEAKVRYSLLEMLPVKLSSSLGSEERGASQKQELSEQRGYCE